MVAEHLQAIASVEKIHDDEKSRQIMAVEMRLAERKALAQEMVFFLWVILKVLRVWINAYVHTWTNGHLKT